MELPHRDPRLGGDEAVTAGMVNTVIFLRYISTSKGERDVRER